MKTYFFDYYHPYAGLCNQLYLITNHIHKCYELGNKLYINKVNTDIFRKERIHANEIFDIDATNNNLEKLLGSRILATEPPEIVEEIPELCIYPVSSIEILNCLEFNQQFTSVINNLKSVFNGKYNAIHFRLDTDSILHYAFGKKEYNAFMDHSNTNSIKAEEYFNSLDQRKIEKYCSFLIEQYFTFVSQFGFDKCWYISTPITKWNIHKPVEKYLKQFTDFILSNGGSFYIPIRIYEQRELTALIDLLMLRDSEKLIGFEGSSFSEGYCLKVNTVRNVTKNFLFVKEYP